MKKLLDLTATEIAGGIKSKKFTSVQVVKAYLTQINKYNDKVNAIVTPFKNALKRAQAADLAIENGENWGELHGVPITIKDSWETKGVRTTASFKPLKNYIPDKNAIIIENILAQGAIILGKTNLPMLASDIQTNSPIFGRSNNPWDLNRTPGGSTGGGAAAVSSRFSPIEIGSDLAGSIRIPAHFCGVYGFKPTEGVLSLEGHIPPRPGKPITVIHQAHAGMITRSVKDLELTFKCLGGKYKNDIHKPIKEFKITWIDNFNNIYINEDTKKTVTEFIELISDNFTNVLKEKPSKINFNEIWGAFGNIAGYEMGKSMSWLQRFLYKQTFKKSHPMYKGLYKGLGLDDEFYKESLNVRSKNIQMFNTFFNDYDIWICPVATRQAFPHLKTGKDIKIDNRTESYMVGVTAYTSVFNLTGLPVVVIPIGFASDGLPIGIQLIAKSGNDKHLLEFAKEVDKLLPIIRYPNTIS